MSKDITAFNIDGEKHKVDYEALANKPELPVDTNTTYTLRQDPLDSRKVTLIGSDGSEQQLILPEDVDTNTTYTASVKDGKLVLTSSDGATQEIDLPEPDLTGYAAKSEVEALREELSLMKLAYGGNVVLSNDIKNPERVTVKGNTTLDLNGHEISTNQKYLFVINPGASLTINDTTGKGKIKAVFSENEGAIKVSGGSLTINGGTIESGDGQNGGVVFVNDGGSVTINGGDLSSASAVITGNNLQGDINITVNGGTLSTKFGAAIYDPAQGKVNINGGVINGGISARMGQITITDGTINATPDNIDSPATYYNYSGNAWYADAVYIHAGTYTSKNAELGNSLNLEITGGTFNVANGQGTPVAIYDVGRVEQKAKVTVKGGTFKTNAADRQNVQVFSLADIGITDPKDGCGKYSGHVVVEEA